MIEVVIMRGLPGSTKTTWIENYLEINQPFIRGFSVCSADQYMVNAAGDYEFQVERLARSHANCLRKFIDDLLRFSKNDPSENHVIFVDNTNLRLVDIAPYVRVAQAFNAAFRVIYIQGDPKACAARNIHGVPLEQVEAMAKGIEPLPSDWPVEFVWYKIG